VAVLFGGRSSEHEISLRSAVFILRQIPAPWRIIPVGITRLGQTLSLEGTFTSDAFSNTTPNDLEIFLKRGSAPGLPFASVVECLLMPYRREILETIPDSTLRILNLEAEVFFPVLHGPNGEDGRLQGVFEMAEAAYVGCDLRASAIGIDKHLQKRLAKEAGVAIAKYQAVSAEEWGERSQVVIRRVEERIGFPCFVKPNAMGSAVGCGRAKDAQELSRLIEDALRYDSMALVEEPMSGTEVECAFLGTPVHPRISVPGEIAPTDFYSYDAKYGSESDTALFVPARLTPERTQELKLASATVATALGLQGLCRIDFWNCAKTGRFVFNEVNTLPGLTSISMFPKLWEHEGLAAPSWIAELLERALLSRNERLNKHYEI
jgi:D-alanine-D-alanine ligase